MKELIRIKQLDSEEESSLLDKAFFEIYPWYSSHIYFRECLEENRQGKRVTLLAYYGGQLAGCCHLLLHSEYPYFRDHKIPEINDLNVFPEFRRRKIASRLFDELEGIASLNYHSIGLGVGLYKDYGNAQRMYGKRGYVMDGQGLTYKNQPVQGGESVRADDDLLIYLVKELRQGAENILK